jgi:nitroimidazol reductase NimA-like FMN-containing flavoprotein (pyridoxamine 5'-phosphate oxidase superfamily)
MEAPMSDASFTPTSKTQVRRMPKRGHYDHATVHAILDAGAIAHVGYVIDGQPFVTPTAYWRKGDRIYWHGSSASRMLRTIEAGSPVCVTVALIDGFVMARSAFHHSVNYRSVMAFGMAHKVTDDGEVMEALKDFTERLYPGRWDVLRPVQPQELKATTVLAMDLTEVVAKVRTGMPVDDDEDYALPIWAGVLPVQTTVLEPLSDPKNLPGVEAPRYRVTIT